MDEREKRLGEKVGFTVVDAPDMRGYEANDANVGLPEETEMIVLLWRECLRLMAQQEQMLGALRQKGGAMKKAQPTRTADWKLLEQIPFAELWQHKSMNYEKEEVVLDFGTAQAIETLLGEWPKVKAELKQVRRAFDAAIRELGRVQQKLDEQTGKVEASESREKRVREALKEPLNELDKQEWRDIVSGVRPDITNRDFDDMWVKFQEVKQRRSQQ